MDQFISCDWGTSSFRLRLIDADRFKVVAEVKKKEGNASMDEAFRNSGEHDRTGFYLSFLEEQIAALEDASPNSLQGLPLLISGMASSTIGIRELPYKPLPFRLDGSDLRLESLGTIGNNNEILLISGACTTDDVMRGEEVQVVGCGIEPSDSVQMMLHPGTHAKHIMIEGDRVTGFHTYMTGELFSLLSEKSILANSVAKPDDGAGTATDAAFREGVQTGHDSNIIHSLFLVRSSRLFGKKTPEEAYRYLSGLLIGHELRAIPDAFTGKLYLGGDKALVDEYRLALETLGIPDRLSLQLRDGDDITFRGQYAVYTRHMDQ